MSAVGSSSQNQVSGWGVLPARAKILAMLPSCPRVSGAVREAFHYVKKHPLFIPAAVADLAMGNIPFPFLTIIHSGAVLAQKYLLPPIYRRALPHSPALEKHQLAQFGKACKRGDIDLAIKIGKRGLPLNKMIASAVRNNPALVNKLVDEFDLIGGNYAKEKELVDLLTEACKNGNEETVEVLLKAGIAPVAPGKCDPRAIIKPLQTAIENGHKDIARRLMRQGYYKETNVWPKQDVDLDELLLTCVKKGDIEKARLCIQAKGEVSTEMVVTAVQNKNLEMVKLLVESGKGVLNCANKTPLHAAVEADDANMVTFLLENGALPDINGNVGLPITVAIDKENLQICRLLIDAKAAPDLERMEKNKNPDIVRYAEELQSGNHVSGR